MKRIMNSKLKVVGLLTLICCSFKLGAFELFGGLNPNVVRALDITTKVVDSVGRQSHDCCSVEEKATKNSCIEMLFKAEDSWNSKGKEPLVSAIYLTSRISFSSIKNSPDELNPKRIDSRFKGLAKGHYLQANSWSPASAPHLDSNCGKFWEVKRSFLAHNDHKVCRVVEMGLEGHSYNMVFCEGEHNVFVDHRGVFSEEDKIITQ